MPGERGRAVTSTPSLGRLEQVPLRDIWQSEAGDFTPWLAKPENIALLGDTIGIDLEVEAEEKEVGPFRADILCRDTVADDAWVLIENQLERTDHTHLGQLMTYAAGLRAVTIVWISSRFTAEHRAALDWLNSITSEEFSFFGLEVEAWRIGNSEPAPKFNMESSPNEWSRQVTSRKAALRDGELSESKQMQLEFWVEFQKYALEHATRIKPQKPQPRHWMTLAIGRTGFTLAAVASLWDNASQSYEKNELRAELGIRNAASAECLESLRRDRDALEVALGEPLNWYSEEGVQRCRAFVRREADLSARDRWPEYHAWLLQRLDRMHELFQPRIMQLDVEALSSEGS